MEKHAWTHDHAIDFTNSKVIDNRSHRTRRTLESWLTGLTNNVDNNSQVTSRTVYYAHYEKHIVCHIGTALLYSYI